MDKPWVEKYRPKTLDDIVGQDEIVKRLKKYVEKKSMPHLLFSGPPGVGKCLTGDTKVIINGEIREIGEVVEEISNGKFGATLVNNIKVLGIDEYGKVRDFDVQYVYKDKTNTLIKIKTKMGRELKVTTYHPLLINNKNGEIKWEKAENLKVGDKLATPRYILFEETEYNEELAEWLGYFIGDGHADSKYNTITFTNSDEKLRRRFAELTEKLFKDAKIKERIHKDRTPDIYVNSKEAIEFIDKLGLRGKKADKVRIPKEIMGSKALKSFLRAYFDCDGGVEKHSVVLSTASKEMAEDLVYALSRFGIIAKLREKVNKNNNKTYYHIVISNSSNLKAFLDNIGFSQERKLEKLLEIIKDENPNLDVVTIDKGKIRYIRDRLKVKLTRDIEKDNWSYNKCKKIAWELLKEIHCRLEELKEIETALEGSILIDWDEVAERRKEIAEKTGIRSDRILEYIKGKRKPILKNYIKIANALGKNIEKTIDAMRIFAKKYSSYAEIGKILNTWNSSVRIYLETNTQEIEKLEEIRKVELKLVRDILNDEKLMDSINYVLFLASNEIYWDEIVEIEQLNGDFIIYDLHVSEYHNFIGGNLPTVLHNTTAALCLARDLFGENWRDNFLELNASDERGIDVIRTKVKDFARTKPIGDVPFKIIFLDESDALTADAQNALRRTMEKYSDVCRFILSCLTENAKIALPDEREIRIDDFIKMFEERKLKHVLNRNGEDLVLAGVKFNSKIVNHKVYRLILESGREIEATGDHKFLTKNGWREVYELKEDDEILVYPTLEGVEFEVDDRKIINLSEFYEFLTGYELKIGYKPLEKAKSYKELITKDKEKILSRVLELLEKYNKSEIKRKIEEEFKIKISLTTIKNLINGKIEGFALRHIKKIKELGWDKITYDDEKAGIFARLLGFVIGDGHLSKSKEGRILITATINELEEIKKDLEKLGIKSSNIIEKDIEHNLDGRKIKGKTSFIYIDNKAFYLLLNFWGVEIGNKTINGYNIPKWIKEGNKFVKREFLRGLFGADGTKPHIKKYNINGIKLAMRVEDIGKDKTLKFFEEIKKMLKEFEIESDIKVSKIDNKNLIELVVKPNNKNYLRYLSRISYAYEKDIFARLIGEYLRIKEAYKDIILKDISEKVLKETNKEKSLREIAREYNVPIDFIRNQLKGKDIGLPRNFMTFEEFLKEKVVDGKYVSEKIIKKECIGYRDVYDITCYKDHSFIANGLISHNCNYPSKIIPPIQSRCAVFRFSPLKKEDIAKKLKEIAENEGLNLTESGLEAIIYVSEGDMRKAINVLQTAAALSDVIDDEIVYKVSSRARPEEVKKMMQLALDGKFIEARDLLYKLMVEWGMSGEDILNQMFREINSLDIDERKKVELADAIGETDFRIVEGANERIQLSALLAKMALMGR